MPMERGGGGGCLSPQNTSGVSEVNFLSAESDAIEVTGDWDVIEQQKKTSKASNLLVCCNPSVPKPRHSDSTWNEVYTVF